MEVYPTGLLPTGVPFVAPGQPGSPVSTGLHLSTAPRAPKEVGESSLPSDDMELLAQILRECHLHDPSGAAASPISAPLPSQPEAAGAAVQADALSRTCHIQPAAVPLAATHQGDSTACVDLESWADEMLRRLQGCVSAEEAQPRAMELLAAFAQRHGNQQAQSEKMMALQGANGVLLRAFRSMHSRSREVERQRRHAEEVNAQLAAELARCQEALRSSERAKGTLQYHLQLMSMQRGIAAGGM
mmetsp:Transcript_120180/g.340232  ORF Transcript_120180/g.340232 Transcript_120180/m.340232 type:complete len:244 (-) Transcript_120180:168-899(-)